MLGRCEVGSSREESCNDLEARIDSLRGGWTSLALWVIVDCRRRLLGQEGTRLGM